MHCARQATLAFVEQWADAEALKMHSTPDMKMLQPVGAGDPAT